MLDTGKSENIQRAQKSTTKTASQLETANYIESCARGLQTMAQKSGLVLLAYLLSMVVLDASELIESLEEKSSN